MINGRPLADYCYVLADDGITPVAADVVTFALWYEKANRRVALDERGDVEVSTVFLGFNRALFGGAPLLWETLVRGGPERRAHSEVHITRQGPRRACDDLHAGVSVIIIMGAGGLAREVHEYAQIEGLKVDAFFDEGADGTSALRGLPILSNLIPGAEVLIAVGDPKLRQRFRLLAFAVGCELAASLVCKPTHISPTALIEAGVIVCPGAVVSCGARVCMNSVVHFNATVGHDVRLGEDSFVAPLASISGNATLGARSYVGTGSAIRQGVRLGLGAVIGAGAAVVKDVPAGTTVVGVPAMPIIRTS